MKNVYSIIHSSCTLQNLKPACTVAQKHLTMTNSVSEWIGHGKPTLARNSQDRVEWRISLSILVPQRSTVMG